MSVNSWNYQGPIFWPLPVNLVVDYHLIFGLLDLDQLAELGGFGGFALADRLGMGFEQAEELVVIVEISLEHTRASLGDDIRAEGFEVEQIATFARYDLDDFGMLARRPIRVSRFGQMPFSAHFALADSIERR